MSKKQRKPVWLVLYALAPLMILALVLIGRDGLPSWANELAGIAIIFFAFGGLLLWVHANTTALLDEESRETKQEEYHFVEYPPQQQVVGMPGRDKMHDPTDAKTSSRHLN